MMQSMLAQSALNALPATLEMLRGMMAINSFTENADGVNRLGEFTAECFAPLGFLPTYVQAPFANYGRHLVLKRPWIDGAPTVALISHLDTVYPVEEEARNHFAWRREGDRIYGPGTNDIKGGTALIHQTLTALAEVCPAEFAGTNWVVLLNACEETISEDFGNLCRAHLPAETRACLIFEADGGEGDGWTLVSARKGRATFFIDAEGRGAHAGSQPRKGANAIAELARLVLEIEGITDFAKGLTVNVGSIRGGTVMNRVPHEAHAEMEMRSFDPAIYAAARRRIFDLAGAGKIPGCTIRVTLDHETVPWPRNPGTDGLIDLWKRTGADLGMKIESLDRGGLSDGNVLWNYFPTLDGLGPRGENSHCSEQSADGSKVQEWVDVSSFVPKAVLNATAVLELIGAGNRD